MRNGDSDFGFGDLNGRFDCTRIADRVDGYGDEGPSSSSSAGSLPVAAASVASSSFSVTNAGGFIEHRVSKFDTLAGIAIKYGVEVADIKKKNGLVTDLQMFALKSLQIPLPGRHPPSPCISNGSSTPGYMQSTKLSASRYVQCDSMDSFQSLRLKPSPPRKVSPAMSSLQGYYGLKPTNQNGPSEGFEMAVCKRGEKSYHLEDGTSVTRPSTCNPPLSLNGETRSLVNTLLNGNNGLVGDVIATEAGEGNSDKSNEKLVRRRQKSDLDFTARSSELLPEEKSNGGTFSAITGKGLALRSKAASRFSLAAESESTGGFNALLTARTDSPLADCVYTVRKSSSASNLQDQDTSNSSSSMWQTSKWSLKPDLQAISAAAITRPIFDGLPKPLSGRKSKAALD